MKCLNLSEDIRTDEELVLQFQQLDQSELITTLLVRYKYKIRQLCRAYFLQGADQEDLLQEAYLGLFKAMRDYNSEKGVAFAAFALLCMKRQVITAVKQSTRQKHLPLNQAISLNKPLYPEENSGRVLEDLLSDRSDNHPEEEFLVGELLREVRQSFQMQFSNLEANLLALYSEGHTYGEMARLLGVAEKTVTNGMYRIQKKLKRFRKTLSIIQTDSCGKSTG